MKSYQLASDFWGGPLCVIRDSGHRGDRIATVPIEFLRQCGDNTWRYIYRVIAELVSEDDFLGAVILDGRGLTVDPGEEPTAGVFIFRRNGSSSSVTFSPGPQYFSAIKAPNPEGSYSTRSDSKRSSVNQSRFRSSLLARDGNCIVSGAHWESCTACHIVPYSRPDVYDSIYGDAGGLPMFRASSGLLLRDDLHHAFDRLYLSLYVKDDIIYVHFFSTFLPGAAEFHGKAIPQSWFRGNPGERPDATLLHWHYCQCVKARIRGFSVGMS